MLTHAFNDDDDGDDYYHCIALNMTTCDCNCKYNCRRSLISSRLFFVSKTLLSKLSVLVVIILSLHVDSLILASNGNNIVVIGNSARKSLARSDSTWQRVCLYEPLVTSATVAHLTNFESTNLTGYFIDFELNYENTIKQESRERRIAVIKRNSANNTNLVSLPEQNGTITSNFVSIPKYSQQLKRIFDLKIHSRKRQDKRERLSYGFCRPSHDNNTDDSYDCCPLFPFNTEIKLTFYETINNVSNKNVTFGLQRLYYRRYRCDYHLRAVNKTLYQVTFVRKLLDRRPFAGAITSAGLSNNILFETTLNSRLHVSKVTINHDLASSTTPPLISSIKLLMSLDIAANPFNRQTSTNRLPVLFQSEACLKQITDTLNSDMVKQDTKLVKPFKSVTSLASDYYFVNDLTASTDYKQTFVDSIVKFKQKDKAYTKINIDYVFKDKLFKNFKFDASLEDLIMKSSLQVLSAKYDTSLSPTNNVKLAFVATKFLDSNNETLNYHVYIGDCKNETCSIEFRYGNVCIIPTDFAHYPRCSRMLVFYDRAYKVLSDTGFVHRVCAPTLSYHVIDHNVVDSRINAVHINQESGKFYFFTGALTVVSINSIFPSSCDELDDEGVRFDIDSRQVLHQREFIGFTCRQAPFLLDGNYMVEFEAPSWAKGVGKCSSAFVIILVAVILLIGFVFIVAFFVVRWYLRDRQLEIYSKSDRYSENALPVEERVIKQLVDDESQAPANSSSQVNAVKTTLSRTTKDGPSSTHATGVKMARGKAMSPARRSHTFLYTGANKDRTTRSPRSPVSKTRLASSSPVGVNSKTGKQKNNNNNNNDKKKKKKRKSRDKIGSKVSSKVSSQQKLSSPAKNKTKRSKLSSQFGKK